MPFVKGQKAHNFKDITGEKYNMLTVKGFYGKNNGKSLWVCQCDCGKEKILSVDRLKKEKSCGCIKRISKREDLIGYENENIIVVSFFETRKGQSYWNCKCKKCGETIQRCSSNIKKVLQYANAFITKKLVNSIKNLQGILLFT